MKNIKRIPEKFHFYQFTKMVILILGLLVALTSCKMSDDGDDDDGKIGEFMISFNANGTLQEFTSDHFPQGSIYDNGSQYTAGFSAVRSASSVGIQVLDNKTVTAKSYTGYSLTQATQQSSAYVIGAVVSYSEGQTGYSSLVGLDSNVTVVISEITTTSIRGTFSGTLKSSGEQDLVVTNGKFYVLRVAIGA